MQENGCVEQGNIETLLHNVLYFHIHSRTLHINKLISGFGLLSLGHEKFGFCVYRVRNKSG